jgi:cell division protein FtsB
MSQQINLLRPKADVKSEAIWIGAALGLVVLILLGYFQVLASETRQLRNAVSAGERKLSENTNAIQSLQRQKDARGNAESLTAEIAALKPRVDAVSQLVKDLKSGSLGSPEGFARYFGSLGSASEPGLWVTNVTITKGGRAVSISGRAMRNESVMQYARRLNEAFKPYGVNFDTLEMTPEAVQPSGAPGKPVLATVAFKLS